MQRSGATRPRQPHQPQRPQCLKEVTKGAIKEAAEEAAKAAAKERMAKAREAVKA